MLRLPNISNFTIFAAAVNILNMGENRIVCVHPVVLFTVIDSYERRKEDAKRVVGTLLGRFSKLYKKN